MVIRVYWASVTGNRKISGDQSRLRNLIESMNLESTWIDVTTSSSVMKKMRQECSNPKALPPQIFNDDVYLGNVDDMNQSIEDGNVKQWLRLEVNNDANEFEQKTEEIIACTQSQSNSEPTSNNTDANSVDIIPKIAPSEEIKSSNSVSSAISNFENFNKSPEVSQKTITLQFGKSNDKKEADDKAQTIDEERRRRILGLPPTEENGSHDSNCLQDKTNEKMSETKTGNGVSKIRSIYDMPGTTS